MFRDNTALADVDVGRTTRDLARKAQETIEALLLKGHPLLVSWSGGKDSSALLNMALVAASAVRKQRGDCPPVIVTNADTGIENPEIRTHVDREIRRIDAFAASRGIDVRVYIAKPRDYAHWATQTIGRRALPTYEDSLQRRCSWDYKVLPMKRLTGEILGSVAVSLPPIRLMGTRFSESAVRSKKMTDRGESSSKIRRDSRDSIDSLSPIADFSTDDIWVYLAEVRDGVREGYSDFKETFRVYRDASGET